MRDMSLARPEWLSVLFVALPVVLLIWLVELLFSRRRWAGYGDRRLLEKLGKPRSILAHLYVLLSLLAICALLVGALADPVQSYAPQIVAVDSMRIALVMDVSNSMGVLAPASVFSPKTTIDKTTYFDLAKLIILKDLLPTVVGNKVGVIAFSSRAYVQYDLTIDPSAIHWVLDHWLLIGRVNANNSDYGEGLSVAIDLLTRDDTSIGQTPVIVLFSDGGFDGDENAKAALNATVKTMLAKHIKLIIIGLGPDSPVTVPVFANGLQTGVFTLDDGTVPVTQYDEANLLALQQQSGGQYIRARSSDIEIAWPTSYQSATSVEVVPNHLYQLPLGVAMLILFTFLSRGILTRLLNQFKRRG